MRTRASGAHGRGALSSQAESGVETRSAGAAAAEKNAARAKGAVGVAVGGRKLLGALDWSRGCLAFVVRVVDEKEVEAEQENEGGRQGRKATCTFSAHGRSSLAF